jgi:hypothetical protein
MRIEKWLKSLACLLFLASSVGFAHATGELWFGGQGPASGTASGVSDDRVGFLNSEGTGLTTVAQDPSTNSYYSVGLDTNAGLYFAFASDGILRSGLITTGQSAQTYSGTGLSGLDYIGTPGDAQFVISTTDIAKLYTADASTAPGADSPAVFVRGPFGQLGTFSASYTLLGANVPPGTSPYWVLWVSAPGDFNPADEIAVIQLSAGTALNDSSTIHVLDPNNKLGSYFGDTLATLDSTSVGTNAYTFGDMTVDWAGVEIGNWGVSASTSASADIESLSMNFAVSGSLQQLHITDVPASDLAYAFAVDPAHHIIYLGLWGDDISGADMIEIPYDPATGVMTSPYDPNTGSITNEAGVLMSFESTGENFVMAREMWVAPGGDQIYYVDNDFGDPGDFADNVKINGVYVVNTTVADPQPQLLSLASQFPVDNSQGYIVGLAVNPPKNLIYFATSGFAPGVGTASNTIWSMPITGGAATAMRMPAGVSLVYPNSAGGCLALDSNAQILYVSDQGRGTVMQLSLSANGTNFTGSTTNFFTLDARHLTDGQNGFPSAFVQGLDFEITPGSTPPPPPTPRLTIVRQGDNAVVSWPTDYSGYTLQFASGLAGSTWVAYPGPFVTNGSTITVTNKLLARARFFRLSY